MTVYDATRKFNRDPRTIAARKQYRADLKAKIPEREAWAKADAIFSLVRFEIWGGPTPSTAWTIRPGECIHGVGLCPGSCDRVPEQGPTGRVGPVATKREADDLADTLRKAGL